MQINYRHYKKSIHVVENNQVLPFTFAVLLLRYNFKCLFKLNFDKGYVGIAEIWWFLNLKIMAVAILDFLNTQNFNRR